MGNQEKEKISLLDGLGRGVGHNMAHLWLLMFGSPIPLCASAKLAAPKHSFLLGGAAYIYLLIRDYPAALLVILFALAGLWSVLTIKKLPKNYKLILLFSFLYLFAATITAGSFPWYYAPLLPAFSVFVWQGITTIAEPPKFFTRKTHLMKKNHFVNTIRIFGVITMISLQLFILGKNFF